MRNAIYFTYDSKDHVGYFEYITKKHIVLITALCSFAVGAGVGAALALWLD